jgi:hypothetical protein
MPRSSAAGAVSRKAGQLRWKSATAWAASRFKCADGHVQVENISLIATPELAYSVDIERSRVRLAGTEQFVPMALRVTTIYRPENGEWKWSIVMRTRCSYSARRLRDWEVKIGRSGTLP